MSKFKCQNNKFKNPKTSFLSLGFCHFDLLSFKKRQSGFSMIEALVAISILLVSIVGPMTIAQRGLSTAQISVDQITAFYLAQEGIEYVRFTRDTNIINNRDWLAGLYICLDISCTVDVIKEYINVPQCEDVGDCEPLRIDTRNGQFSYDEDWDESKFTRDIRITQIAPSEIAVDVYVSWSSGSFDKTIVVHDNLFNWQ